VPIAGLLLVQIPPPVASDKVPPAPVHTSPLPVTGNGFGFTVSTKVFEQPVAKVIVMVTVPAETVATYPVVEPIVAMPGAPELHSPPLIVHNVVVCPLQSVAVPVIAAGMGFTVMS